MNDGAASDARIDFETVFESIDIPTLILDADGSVVIWNERLEELLGIDRSVVEGVERIGEVVYDGARERILAEKVLEHPRNADRAYDIERTDGTYALLGTANHPTYEDTSTAVGGSGAHIWFLATPLYCDGELVGVVEFVQPRTDSKRRRREMERLIDELADTIAAFREGDYTARAEYDFAESILDEDDVEVLEEVNHLARMRDALDQQIQETKTTRLALQRRNQQLERFASVIAHDLRNPLNVAAGRLELAREAATEPAAAEHLDAVDRSLDRMSELIDDLLALARAGEVIDETEPVDLGTLAERCWGAIETEEATLAVETDRRIRADESRLRQLLENLVSNSTEHGGADVTITIGALDDGFYLEDDGPGIPDDERERVFESGYSTAEEGTGFGLAIVAEIAEAHEWEVTLAESDDGGARFEFTGVAPAE